MATDKDLIGLGMTPDFGWYAGLTVGAITAAGTASTTATALGKVTLAKLTTASSQTGVILPSDAPLGKPYIQFCLTSDTAKLFPHSGGNINGGTATTGAVDIAQNKARISWRYNSTDWLSILTA